jgi:hypothetical protein
MTPIQTRTLLCLLLLTGCSQYHPPDKKYPSLPGATVPTYNYSIAQPEPPPEPSKVKPIPVPVFGPSGILGAMVALWAMGQMRNRQ